MGSSNCLAPVVTLSLTHYLSVIRQGFTVVRTTLESDRVRCLASCLQDIAADAADILAASPSTLRQELAAQGADLEADWAEAELASTAAQTTTGELACVFISSPATYVDHAQVVLCVCEYCMF